MSSKYDTSVIEGFSEDKWVEIFEELSVEDRFNAARSAKQFFFFFKRYPSLLGCLDWRRKRTKIFDTSPGSEVIGVPDEPYVVIVKHRAAGKQLQLVSIYDGTILKQTNMPSQVVKVVAQSAERLLLFSRDNILYIFSIKEFAIIQSIPLRIPNYTLSYYPQIIYSSGFIFFPSNGNIFYFDPSSLPHEGEFLEPLRLENEKIPRFERIFDFATASNNYLVIGGRTPIGEIMQLFVEINDGVNCQVIENFTELPDRIRGDRLLNFTQSPSSEIYYVHRHSLYKLTAEKSELLKSDLPFSLGYGPGFTEHSSYQLHCLDNSHLLCIHEKHTDGHQFYDEMPKDEKEAIIFDIKNQRLISHTHTPRTDEIIGSYGNTLVRYDKGFGDSGGKIIVEYFEKPSLPSSIEEPLQPPQP